MTAQAGRLLPAEHSGTGWQLRQLLCGSGSDRLQSQQPEPAWSFIDALFFCLTVVTTIGYGQLSPRTAGGQLFCLLYALVGIPISGLLLAGLSDLLAGRLLSFYHTTWAKRHGRSKCAHTTRTLIKKDNRQADHLLSALTRAPLGSVYNTPYWGGGGLFIAPPPNSETTGPIVKIQTASDSPGKTVERNLISLTSRSPMTSQVRSK
ncbi:Potassium channel subfamily K member 10 [Amphibalanus amphitrite]|uniref:Potassium channel subfamily K member 10 n=1 Tax=Amphibalanus amphitrite TaxID=1232801 RepID=A0A6A4X3R3_AMPAM|nr:Potassium channel subfamily K member 10 [Amphibalanus amphitrite]